MTERRSTTSFLQNVQREVVTFQINNRDSKAGGGSCLGDSGGPAFSGRYIVGDASYVNSLSCNAIGSYQRVDTPYSRAEDIALGYKQLLEIERGWRDMKTTLDLRPVYHRREDRIRAHIVLCWLALLLIRVAETETGHTWAKIRAEIDRLHVGVFTGPAGTFAQRTELSQPQKALLAKLNITVPSRVLDATPTTG